MTFKTGLLTTLRRTNPIPDPDELIDSDAARELAVRSPMSVLDWRVVGEGQYAAGHYQIQLVAPEMWEVTNRGELVAHDSSLTAAFSRVEHRHRETLRTRDLFRLGAIVVLAFVALFAIEQFVAEITVPWVVVLVATVYIAVAAGIRFQAVFTRHVDDPYRRLLPWEKARKRQNHR